MGLLNARRREVRNLENEKRLIDANYALQQIEVGENENGGQFQTDSSHIKDFLNVLPTVDAVEVMHGRWVHNKPWLFGFECDQCGKWILPEGTNGDMNYCPNCGAKMDGK